MRKFLSYLVAAAVIFMSLPSCVDEPFESGRAGEGEADVTLAFGSAPMDIVVTRAGHTLENESRIYNLHVFIFDKDCNKVYSRYFSESDKQDSDSGLWPGQWYVVPESAKNGNTSGVLKMRVPVGEELKIYIYANLDADMVRVSEELLNHAIQDENDLIEFQCYLNQTIVGRNGYFPMSGRLDNVTISKGEYETEATITPGALDLYRIDAKVTFTFKTGNRPDENGQKITSFEALQWRVLNVPRTCYAINLDHDDSQVNPKTDPNDYSKYAQDFFDTDYVNFETYNDASEGKPASFTFYMLENHQVSKKTPGEYQDRSRQLKNDDGTNRSTHVTYVVDGKTYERDMRVFEYANDFSTYVMVTGRVTMQLENDDAGQVLGADVTYLIHLGTWKAAIDGTGPGDTKDTYSNFGDYGIERNTFYDYTVTVNSVHNIRVEVETSKGAVSGVKENQPGAMGFVTIAREEIALCDAHYESKTLTFHLANFFDGGVQLGTDGRVLNADKCVANKLTWEVETPFSTGGPRVIDGIDITSGLDYKWVHFRLNKKDAAGNYLANRRKFLDPDKYPFEYSSSLRDGTAARPAGNKEGDGTDGLDGYHNDGVFDIVSLVKYMKEQVNKYLVDPATSDFDQGTNSDGNLDPKICLTAFVDEFYYEAHPLTGAKSTTLWKKFVNQPDRSVHILCNSDISKDLESRTTGSVVTIQQHAIQSVYNTDEDYTSLQTAWGTEYTDEFSDVVKTYNTNSSEYAGSGSNSSNENGLLNSLYEWGLCSGGSFIGNQNWGNYLDFEVPNSTPQIQDKYKSLRYFCMARNRDNNGDGKIDGGEVRWYLASIRQLIGLYVGDGLLNQNSRLYYRTSSQRASDDVNVWRQHVISSTKYKDESQPTLIWAEEGIATGSLSASFNETKLSGYSIRCVRNLGLDLPNDPSSDDLNSLYDPLVTVTGTNTESDPYVVACTNLNQNSLRYYTSRELEYASNESEQNRLYMKFEVSSQTISHTSQTFQAVNSDVTEKGSSYEAGYCPQGYRLPNQLELAMMRFYCNGVSHGSVSRTYWSMGVVPGTYGNSGKDGRNKYGFVDNENITLDVNYNSTTQRCVRDIRVD